MNGYSEAVDRGATRDRDRVRGGRRAGCARPASQADPEVREGDAGPRDHRLRAGARGRPDRRRDPRADRAAPADPRQRGAERRCSTRRARCSSCARVPGSTAVASSAGPRSARSSAPSVDGALGATRGHAVRPTSWTAPSTIRQARRLGAGRRIGLVRVERHQQVQRLRVEGEPDVGRRRHRRRVGVRVDDAPEDLVGVVGLDRQAEQVGRVDLVAVRRRRLVAGRARSGGRRRRRPPARRRRSGRRPRSGTRRGPGRRSPRGSRSGSTAVGGPGWLRLTTS